MAPLVKRVRWTGPAFGVLGAAAGICLMIAPSAFRYVDTPTELSHRIVGPVLTLLWIVSVWDITRSVRWWTVPFALWLMIEPFVLDDAPMAGFTAVAVGVLCLACAILADNGDVKQKYAGGWIGLWSPTPPPPPPAEHTPTAAQPGKG